MTREEYEADIAGRVSRAVKVPFRRVAAGDWTPQPNDCHHNVDTWVKANVGLTAVRGWVVESVGSVTAHSVVRDHDGQLFDITPFRDETLRLGFIEHHGDGATFGRMKAAGTQIFCWTVDPAGLAEQMRTMQDGEPSEYDDSESGEEEE
jgi:hypothetical protein